MSLTIFKAKTQIIFHDQSGDSPIIVSGGSVGVDVKESLIKANYYSPTIGKPDFFWGIDMQGKNTEGIAGLFSNSEFHPQTKATITFGFFEPNFIYYDDKGKKIAKKDINKLENDRDKLFNELLKKTEVLNNLDFKRHINNLESVGAFEIATKIKSLVENQEYYNFEKEILKIEASNKKDLQNDSNTNSVFQNFKQFISKNKNELDKYNQLYNQRNKIIDSIKKIKQNKPSKYTKNKYYFRGGLNASEFKFDLMNDSSMIDQRFIDTLEIFGTMEVGFTRRNNRSIWGTSLRFNGISSFNNLDNKKYSFVESDTSITNGILTSKNEFEAYSGNYFKTTQLTFSADYIRMFIWNENDRTFLGLGFYFRSSWFKDNNDLEKIDNHSVLGGSINLIDGIKGQFLGGLYIQSNDIFNQNDEELTSSLSFGITTRFIINNGFNVSEKAPLD